MRGIEERPHDNTNESTSNGDSHNPCKQEETDSLEVDSLEGTVAKTDTNSGTSDAHGSGDWERVLREDEEGHGGHPSPWMNLC